MATPSLASLIPKLEEALVRIAGVQRVAIDHAVIELSKQRKRVDKRHDGCTRTAFYLLEAHVHRARTDGDTATEAVLVTLRDKLFPYGLDVVNFSYAEEAGQASLLAARITPEDERVLAGIPMKDGTLLNVVHNWLQAGTELGRLESELADIKLPSRRGPVAAARNRWIRTVAAIRTVAGLEASLHPRIERALHQVVMVENAAARRLRGAASTDEDNDTASADDADADSATGAGADTATGAGADTATGADADTATGADADTATGADATTDSDATMDADSGSSSNTSALLGS